MPKKRDEIKDNLKWKLTDIYKSEGEFDALLKEIEREIDFKRYEGKLGDENILLECFEKMDEIETRLEKLDFYAFLKKDLDTRDSAAVSAMSRADAVLVKYSAAVSFIVPEITALDEEKLKQIIADERFKAYDYSLSRILAGKVHTLSKESENVLALGGQVFMGFHDIF